MRLCDRDDSGCPRPIAGLVMQGCKVARRWLRLCQAMAAVVPGDGCGCAIAMAAAV